MAVSLRSAQPTASEEADLVQRAARRDVEAIRAIVKRYNQRLYRVARAVVKSDSDAEEVLQETYLRAFSRLDGFRGESSLSTWLTRITLNQAHSRLRNRARLKRAASDQQIRDAAGVIPFPGAAAASDPERAIAQRQLVRLVERATEDLPESFRLVFVARIIEGLSVEETAAALGLQPATVKTRLHRARKLVRERLEAEIGPVLVDAFPFAGKRCERLTAAVLDALGRPA